MPFINQSAIAFGGAPVCFFQIQDISDSQGYLAAIGSIGAYLISTALHGELFPILGSIAQYFFMLPT